MSNQNEQSESLTEIIKRIETIEIELTKILTLNISNCTYDEILSLTFKINDMNNKIDQLYDKVKTITDMYSASVEMFMLKDCQSDTFYNQLKNRLNLVESHLIFIWNKLMAPKYSEFHSVDIPYEYEKYIPPHTSNKLLISFFKKSLKNLKNFMQRENKHYARNREPNTNVQEKKKSKKRKKRKKID